MQRSLHLDFDEEQGIEKEGTCSEKLLGGDCVVHNEHGIRLIPPTRSGASSVHVGLLEIGTGNCGNCRFFRKNSEDSGVCRIVHIFETRYIDDWCGEYKPDDEGLLLPDGEST